MKSWAARVLGASCAVLLATGAVAATLGNASAATSQAGGGQHLGRGQAQAAVRHVIVVGIAGLDWTDISRSQTPNLWQLAARGSVGSLVDTAIRTFTCPADAWLTLNSGARSAATASVAPCSLPQVIPSATGSTAPARVPAMAGHIENVNAPFSYGPCWGVLAGTYAPVATCPARPQAPAAGCATAIGPGAALALASPAGKVSAYAADVGTTTLYQWGKCPLSVVDLGSLPAPTSAPNDRSRAAGAADQAVGKILAAAPPGATVVVAGLGDVGAAHVHAIIISGPGFASGMLKAASTRQPGLVVSTDLTPTILHWLGRGAGNLVGSVIASSPRGSLASAVTTLAAQDTSSQVYRATLGWFFVIYALAEALVIGLIALLMRGDAAERRDRRHTAYRVAGVAGASVPAGTFLANLVPWAQWSHPALALYGISLAWAAVIAALALAGPWRREPLGSAGFVGAVTAAVIAVDVVTGSHLQLSAPFGLPVLVAGRWYGIGNNALGVYAAGGLIAATWAGVAAHRAGSRVRAVLAAGAVAAALLIACAAPAFGAKVGGTIAMTPAFLLLIAAFAGIRITPARVALIAVSGLVLITGFAVLSYLYPAVGVSDIGAFVGHVLHGSAGPILNRKASANLHSVTETWFTPVVPLIVALFGAVIIWPERLRLTGLARAFAAQPLLRPLFVAIWTAGVIGWLADDSGVSVTAAMLPLALPLAIVMATLAAWSGAAAAAPDGTPGPQAGGQHREGSVQAPHGRG